MLDGRRRDERTAEHFDILDLCQPKHNLFENRRVIAEDTAKVTLFRNRPTVTVSYAELRNAMYSVCNHAYSTVQLDLVGLQV